MGIIAELCAKTRLPGSRFIGTVTEAVFDGACVLSGPAGWAVLGAKTAAYQLFFKKSFGETLAETWLSAGLGAIAGHAVTGRHVAPSGASTSASQSRGLLIDTVAAVQKAGAAISGKVEGPLKKKIDARFGPKPWQKGVAASRDLNRSLENISHLLVRHGQKGDRLLFPKP